MKKIVTVIVAVVALIFGYVYYTPYLMVRSLTKAVEAQDSDKVVQYIDFDSVKDNVGEQLKATFMKLIMSSPTFKNNPNALSSINLDREWRDSQTTFLVSPVGMTKMMGGINPINDGKTSWFSSSASGKPNPALIETNLVNGKGEYLDSNHFQLTIPTRSNRQGKLIFERERIINWKMKKMIYPDID